MYKIQNVSGKNLSLSLERGSVTLRPNGSFDLDTCCSRKWISNSRELAVFFRAQALKLLLDSQAVVATVATKQVVTPVPVVTPKGGVIRVKPIGDPPIPPAVLSIPSLPVSLPAPVKDEVVKEVFTPPTDLEESLVEPKLPEVKATPIQASELISYDPIEEHLKKLAREEETEDNVAEDVDDEEDEDFEEDSDDDEYL